MVPGYLPPSPHASGAFPHAPNSPPVVYLYPPMVQGEHVMVSAHNSVFPLVCPKCGEAAHQPHRTELTYINPWWYLTLAGGVVVFAVIAVILQKKATLNPHICAACVQRSKRLKLLPLVGMAAFVSSLFTIDSSFVWVVGVGFAFLLFTLIYSGVKAKLLVPKLITRDTVTLKNVHPNFRAILPIAP